jgi:prepilin-type N-terminal cleavage/methylation domain-containing protein
MTRQARARGFTLIELLIAIALMMILITAITMIFVNTTEVVAVQEARMTVYTNARYAMDTIRNDLMGMTSVNAAVLSGPGSVQQGGKGGPAGGAGGGTVLPFMRGAQSFWMENGFIPSPGTEPTYNRGGAAKLHIENAADRICFRTTTTVADTIQTVEVMYYLLPSDKVIDHGDATTFPAKILPGDSTHRHTATTQRGMNTLIRRIRANTMQDAQNFGQYARVKDRVSGLTVEVPDQELCHYVVSFNIEFLASTRVFSQLDPSPCPRSDPLGDGMGANDLMTPLRIPALRMTLVVTEDFAERQERVIQQTFWLPQQ